jgi:uncharacterized protein YecE (DUF72 family)
VRIVRAWIGCSGWQYLHWRGNFYPADLPLREWLPYYASTFDTVEVNNSFYRLPERETFRRWRDATPDRFLMAVKASRYLTHLKKLREPAEPVARLFDRLRGLGSRLGPVLYQLPRNFAKNLERLRDLLLVLPHRLPGRGKDRPAIRHVFEFRHPSWYEPDVLALLHAHGAALCLHDRAGSAITDDPASPFVYVRFHGPGGGYHGSYDDRHLERWAGRMAAALDAGREVFAYFNNDPEGAAVRDALRLNAMLTASAGNAGRSRAAATRRGATQDQGRTDSRRTRR